MKKLTYKQAGVDIDKGEEASRIASKLARITFRKEVVERNGVAAFSAKFRGYKDPLLLGATDGVGTKLKLAFLLNKHRTIGQDLVAMCTNDLVRRGAEPIIFLPYLATGKIDVRVARQISEGISKACREAGCAILGGETAELPDFYQKGEYDLAGTAIGVVEKDKIIDGSQIRAGDVVLGLASNGLHSNGYSLARKVLAGKLRRRTIGDVLLRPTKLYVKPVLKLLQKGVEVHGIAHITGGGLPAKLAAIIPKGLTARVDKNSLPKKPIFSLIQREGQVSEKEMFRTFNMGIGMVLVVPEKEEARALRLTDAVRIGRILKGRQKVEIRD